MNCIRCGKPIEDGQAVIELQNARFGSAHLRCEVVAVKRHVFYYRFFLGLAVFGALCIAGGTVSDAMTGHKIGWEYAKLFVPMLLGIFGLPLLIRKMVIPWAQRVEQMAAEDRLGDN